MDIRLRYRQHLSQKVQKTITHNRRQRQHRQEQQIHHAKPALTYEKALNPTNPLQPNRLALPKNEQIQNPKLRLIIQDEIHSGRQKQCTKVIKIPILQIVGKTNSRMVTSTKRRIITKTDTIGKLDQGTQEINY